MLCAPSAPLDHVEYVALIVGVAGGRGQHPVRLVVQKRRRCHGHGRYTCGLCACTQISTRHNDQKVSSNSNRVCCFTTSSEACDSTEEQRGLGCLHFMQCISLPCVGPNLPWRSIAAEYCCCCLLWKANGCCGSCGCPEACPWAGRTGVDVAVSASLPPNCLECKVASAQLEGICPGASVQQNAVNLERVKVTTGR